jgi:hypothetical protein
MWPKHKPPVSLNPFADGVPIAQGKREASRKPGQITDNARNLSITQVRQAPRIRVKRSLARVFSLPPVVVIVVVVTILSARAARRVVGIITGVIVRVITPVIRRVMRGIITMITRVMAIPPIVAPVPVVVMAPTVGAGATRHREYHGHDRRQHE